MLRQRAGIYTYLKRSGHSRWRCCSNLPLRWSRRSILSTSWRYLRAGRQCLRRLPPLVSHRRRRHRWLPLTLRGDSSSWPPVVAAAAAAGRFRTENMLHFFYRIVFQESQPPRTVTLPLSPYYFFSIYTPQRKLL